jgi:hypothetical protein
MAGVSWQGSRERAWIAWHCEYKYGHLPLFVWLYVQRNPQSPQLIYNAMGSSVGPDTRDLHWLEPPHSRTLLSGGIHHFNLHFLTGLLTRP